MYGSVQEYFEAECPELVEMLDNSGGYWPKVKDNTIANEDLAANAKVMLVLGQFRSTVCRSSVMLMAGRLTGKVPNPG